MTREEIITQLQDIKCHSQEMYDAEVKNGDPSNIIWGKDVEALTLAIKTLEQPSDDCISRQDAIDAIYKKHVGGKDAIENAPINDMYACGLEEAIDAVENLPSVTPQQTKWIPVSEKVADFPCLACDIFGQIFIPVNVVILNNRCFDGKDFDFDVEKFLKGKEVTLFNGKKVYELPREIVAWMPLPEPYKAESEDAE